MKHSAGSSHGRWYRLFSRAKARRNRALITDAKRSPEQRIHRRELQYFWLQAIRIPIVLLSLLLAWWLGRWWIVPVVLLLSLPIPWVAVMIGNGEGEVRDKRSKNIYKPAVARQQAFEARQQQQLLASQQHASVPPPTIIEHDL